MAGEENLSERVRQILSEAKEPLEVDEIRVHLKQKHKQTVKRKDINKVLYEKDAPFEKIVIAGKAAPKWRSCQYRPCLKASNEEGTITMSLTIVAEALGVQEETAMGHFLDAAVAEGLTIISTLAGISYHETIRKFVVARPTLQLQSNEIVEENDETEAEEPKKENPKKITPRRPPRVEEAKDPIDEVPAVAAAPKPAEPKKVTKPATPAPKAEAAKPAPKRRVV